LPKSIMEIIQMKDLEVQTMPPDILEIVIMHDLGIQTEVAVLGEAKYNKN